MRIAARGSSGARAHLAGIVALGLCAATFLGTRPALADTGDSWLTAKTKISLMTAEDVGGFAIDVDTYDGVVTLHGKVTTAQEKSRAAELAKSVNGVKDVRNLLQVVPETDREATKVSDAQLKDRVSTVIERDAALDDSSVKVASVNKGVVLLSGEAKTISDHLRALEDARAVQGVQRVASEVKSPDKLSDNEIWYGDDKRNVAANKTEKAEQSSWDAWTTASVKLRLLSNREVPGLDINVDTREGVVTLFGAVQNQTTKDLAEKLALEAKGTRLVKNQLQIVAKPDQKQVAEKDDKIQENLKKRIADNPELKDSDVSMEVSKGVVRLTGTVESQRDHLAVLTATRATQGVRSLIDEIKIEEPQAQM
jgi:hyperosmotically inducible protein